MVVTTVRVAIFATLCIATAFKELVYKGAYRYTEISFHEIRGGHDSIAANRAIAA